MSKKKYQKLGLSILFDGIGMLSYLIPGIGELTDIVWAPIAGFLMTRLYKGNVGKAAGVFTLIEEAIPGLDIIPSFTIMWLYTYVFQQEKDKKIIDIE
ncbi:hypothetical protein [Aquimarina rhabdastrellae]